MTPKNARKFDIHYGIAQDLKRKSGHKAELIEYLSDFMASYNAETGKAFEKGKMGRQLIKTNDINELIRLIDEYGNSTVGRLLSAFGFATEPSIWKEKENGILIIKNNIIRIKSKDGKKEIKKVDFNFSSKTKAEFNALFESDDLLKTLGFSIDELSEIYENAFNLIEQSSDEDESDE